MSSLLTFFAVGLVTLLVAGVALSIVGLVFSMAMGLAGFLLFKVAPILLVGWVVLKLVERIGGKGKKGRLSASDRRWLDQS